jgi:hypothetical protein
MDRKLSPTLKDLYHYTRSMKQILQNTRSGETFPHRHSSRAAYSSALRLP